uniref:Movement protein n=1 Tax=Sugarcane streak Reunion virus TaxID=78395 RepID=A0A1B0PQG0_9GEMI|nr:movement protein [Sugarcane streak Reunion virus]
MDSLEGASPALPAVALPRVPRAAPSAPALPWSRVGEIAIFTFVAVLALYLLWVWVLRDLVFVLKARRGGSTEELHFVPRERESVASADSSRPVAVPSAPPVSDARPFSV